MGTIVGKFGGTSLANAIQIRKAAAIIKADPDRRYVIASAPGKRDDSDAKVTDLLLLCFEQAAAGEDFSETLRQIRGRFADIVGELGVDLDIDSEIALIEQHLETKPERDYMASRGEYLNSRIVAEYLGFPFLDTTGLIRFYEDGRCDELKTVELLGAALAKTEYAVVPGYYGATEGGSIRTFPRGGSDITGALVARAVKADLYENWTDVSGVLFTDPHIVDNPGTIEYVTYREFRELAYMGASVLHEEAVFPVRSADIPINIRNTNSPEDPGTLIVKKRPKGCRPAAVTGIAGKRGFTSIHIEKSLMNEEVGFVARLLGIIAQAGLSIEHCPSGIDTVSVIVASKPFSEKSEGILTRIRQELQPDSITVYDDMSLIAVVGHHFATNGTKTAAIFRALAEARINIRLIDQGSSGMNIIIGVEERDFESAIKNIFKVCR